MRIQLILLLLFTLGGSGVWAEEQAEPLLVEPPPAAKKDGKFVSPENLTNGTASQDSEEEKRPDPLAVQPPAGKVPAAFMRLGQGEYFSKYAFLLDKSTRTLTVWEQTEKGLVLAEAHPADMGRKSGDKQVLGDKKTPEGIYFFRTIYEAQSLNYNEYGSRAYTMDYPNIFDKRENKTGSGIWLHAIPSTKSLYRGSRGCIVVRDEVITPLGKYVEPGKTPIIVQEKAEYISKDEYQVRLTRLIFWLRGWKKAWESRKVEDYIKNYSDDFRSLGMNKEQWREFKKDLNEKYEFIRIQIAKASFFVDNDEMVIRFLQGYNSNVNSDFGEKALYLKRDADGEFRIIAERWSALPQKLIALLGDTKETIR